MGVGGREEEGGGEREGEGIGIEGWNGGSSGNCVAFLRLLAHNLFDGFSSLVFWCVCWDRKKGYFSIDHVVDLCWYATYIARPPIWYSIICTSEMKPEENGSPTV